VWIFKSQRGFINPSEDFQMLLVGASYTTVWCIQRVHTLHWRELHYWPTNGTYGSILEVGKLELAGLSISKLLSGKRPTITACKWSRFFIGPCCDGVDLRFLLSLSSCPPLEDTQHPTAQHAQHWRYIPKGPELVEHSQQHCSSQLGTKVPRKLVECSRFGDLEFTSVKVPQLSNLNRKIAG